MVEARRRARRVGLRTLRTPGEHGPGAQGVIWGTVAPVDPGDLLRSVLRVAHVVAAAMIVLACALPAEAGAKGYYSPGYKGAKTKPSEVQKPLAPVDIGTGKYPRVLVDAAGTAHISFSTDGGGGGQDNVSYCRLPRGQNSCKATSAFGPTAKPGGQSGPYEGNFPGGDHDFNGPVPLAINDQLAMVSRRFPNVYDTPDGGTSDSNVFLWTSPNGGGSFDGPAQIGDNEMGGGAIVFGGAGNPSIGTISRSQTNGTTFQASGAGQYTKRQALLGPGNQAYDGSLALDGTKPVAVFADNTGTSFIREWTGNGDVNDASTWTSASFAGSSPRVTSGPAGIFVVFRDSLSGGNVLVQKVAGGVPVGAATKVSGAVSDAQIAEDTAGHLTVGYIDPDGVQMRSSTDGVNWTTQQLLAAAPEGGSLGALSIAATGDGGGFATYVKNPVGAEGVGAVEASAFGTFEGTKLPGLGDLPGGGLGTPDGDVFATTSCTDAKFGAVHVKAVAGCLLRDAADKTGSRVVSLGELNLNGLRIVPDTNARIVVDAKHHTIDSFGKVRVILRAPGFGDVTIWHEELHVSLKGNLDGVGDVLADFPAIDGLQDTLEGFPFKGKISVELAGDDGVRIPVSLGLPKVFGGITGSAVLTASLSQGFNLDSLELTVPDLLLKVVEIRDLDIKYTAEGDQWKGGLKLDIPAGGSAFSLDVSVAFKGGQFAGGHVVSGIPYPGIPLDASPPTVFLTAVGIDVPTLDPLTVGGNANFGFLPRPPDSFTVRLNSFVQFFFGSPVTITVGGQAFLFDIPVEEGHITYKVPYTVTANGKLEYNFGPFQEKGTVGLIFDPDTGKYGGSIDGEVSIQTPVPLPDLTLGKLALAVNNNGIGACYGGPPLAFGVVVYATYDWSTREADVDTGCDIKRFTEGIPAGKVGKASAFGFDVAPGTAVTNLRVLGASGAPDLVLVAPDGHEVPASATGEGDSFLAVPNPAHGHTSVAISKPAAGHWTVREKNGSPVSVTGVQVAVMEAAPKVSGKVSGKGATRTLTYKAKVPAGYQVQFSEEGQDLMHVIGTAKRSSGKVRFRPAIGGPSKRTVVARVTRADGMPRTQPAIARFTAPRAGKLGKVKKLKVTVKRGKFTVTFKRAANAVAHVVTFTGGDGRRVQTIVRGKKSKLTFPVNGYSAKASVRVQGLSAAGKRGAAAGAKTR